MIEISKTKYQALDVYTKITHEIKVLHFDEEPILFTGYNRLENILLCSVIDDNCGTKIKQFLEVIIDKNTLNDFLTKKITYLNILEKSCKIFVVNKSFDNKIYKSYYINFEDIPKEYLPSKDSFCPELSV